MAEEAPLCRFRQIEIIGRGDGISPNLVENLHIVRRVGTLFVSWIVRNGLQVFPLGGENYKHKKLNWEKVARMRRKRGARRLKISDTISDNQL